MRNPRIFTPGELCTATMDVAMWDHYNVSAMMMNKTVTLVRPGAICFMIAFILPGHFHSRPQYTYDSEPMVIVVANGTVGWMYSRYLNKCQ